MSTPKEFRLGNTILYHEFEHTISAISEHSCTIDPKPRYGGIVIDWKFIEGVPVTEKGLQKLGFKFDQENGHYFVSCDVGRGRLMYTFDDGQGNPLIMWRYDVGCGEHLFIDKTEYEFIHQIQNLMFALFGKEQANAIY